VGRERILIEGIGGIGGIIAAKMIRAGHSPVLVTHNLEITEAIDRGGLDLTTSKEQFIVPARASPRSPMYHETMGSMRHISS
jgi:ketopantoate reductase